VPMLPPLLALLAACSDANIGLAYHGDSPAGDDGDGGADTAPIEQIDDTGPIADTGPDPIVTEEAAGELDEDSLADFLFSLDRIHTVAITLPDASVTAINGAPYEWAEADVTIDDVPMASVGVRLRGKIGSFRALSGKPKFKIGFNEFVAGQRFYGLEELSLNNAVVDCSYEKEILGYRVFAAAGVPSLRTSYATVTVNGAPYGLYILLETPSDRFLHRTYPDPSGNLYDGKYVWYSDGSYTLLDFGAGVDSLFQLEEGTDVGNADVTAVSDALLASAGTTDFYTTVGAVLDWDEFHRMFAAEQYLGHNDGYTMNTNNYRVYFDPTDGRADILPWDLDYSLLYDYQWGLSWSSPRGRISAKCLGDATCVAVQRTAIATFLTSVEAVDWLALLDQVEALTYAATQADPRRECAAADVQPWRDYVRSWVVAEPAALRAWWGL
jgi:hypothetical protein